MTFDLARRLFVIAFGIWAGYAMSRQCRRPNGWFGRRIARAMNLSHGNLTDWGLGLVPIESRWHILDVGCGGGQTVRHLSEMASEGHVDGVDYSEASIDTAIETNGDLMSAGRVAIRPASVSQLPFGDRSFDLVTAVETHYYWPDFPRDLREVLRVLKPGGRVAIIAETYKGRRFDWLYRPVMRGIFRATYLSLDEHRAALTEAGFMNVEVHDNRARGWMCAVGTR